MIKSKKIKEDDLLDFNQSIFKQWFKNRFGLFRIILVIILLFSTNKLFSQNIWKNPLNNDCSLHNFSPCAVAFVVGGKGRYVLSYHDEQNTPIMLEISNHENGISTNQEISLVCEVIIELDVGIDLYSDNFEIIIDSGSELIIYGDLVINANDFKLTVRETGSFRIFGDIILKPPDNFNNINPQINVDGIAYICGDIIGDFDITGDMIDYDCLFNINFTLNEN